MGGRDLARNLAFEELIEERCIKSPQAWPNIGWNRSVRIQSEAVQYHEGDN
jgi:hypothetical protein